MAERDGDDWLIAAEIAIGRRDPVWPGGIATLLDPSFEEVGASGRSWDRTTIGALLAQPTPVTVRFEDATVDRLSHDVALVRYRTVEPTRQARRVSVWVRGEDSTWRLRYHQGTVVPSDATEAASDG